MLQKAFLSLFLFMRGFGVFTPAVLKQTWCMLEQKPLVCFWHQAKTSKLVQKAAYGTLERLTHLFV